MKNWIRFILVFTLALVTLMGVIVFYQAQKPINQAEEQAEMRAIDEKHLSEITKSYSVNGMEASITVLGKDKDGRPKAAFVPDGSDGDIWTVLLKDGISSKEALSTVRKDMDIGKVIHVHLGAEEDSPYWEVAYTGTDQKLNYVLLDFKDGSVRKKILNL